jgi:putative DNA primase/helicase
VIRSWLLVPVHDIDHNFVTLQIIKPDGFKRLWKGTSQKNNMMWLCDLPLDKRYEGIIRVCEGYATGCTIREITKSPVVCAINANNLLNTVVQLRQNFIHADIRICADNDAYGEINSGLLHGKNAAKRTGSTLYFPTFEGCCIDKKPTDFNDLFILAGKDLVKEILSIPRSL